MTIRTLFSIDERMKAQKEQNLLLYEGEVFIWHTSDSKTLGENFQNVSACLLLSMNKKQ